MLDESGDLELLQEVGPSRVEAQEAEEQAPAGRKRGQAVTYQVEREFETMGDYEEWWNNDGGSSGWKLSRPIYKVKSKDEIAIYRQDLIF